MKTTLLENLTNPYQNKEELSFEEFVKCFTNAISRLHTYVGTYDINDLADDLQERYVSEKFLNFEKVVNINLADCPKTYDNLNMDSDDYLDVLHKEFKPRDNNKDSFLNQKYRTIERFLNLGMSVKEWRAGYKDFSYNINSIGLRNDFEFDDLQSNEFIPVFGCSHTFGVGNPTESLWHSNLNEDKPIFNCGMSASGIVEVYLLLTKLFKEKPFKKAYVCAPHLERTAHISNKGFIEGGTFYQITLKEWYNINECFNKETRNMYSNIVLSALKDFCKVNDIELIMYARHTFWCMKDCIDWNIILPSTMRTSHHPMADIEYANSKKHSIETLRENVGRDCTHFGSVWHSQIANVFKNRLNKYLS